MSARVRQRPMSRQSSTFPRASSTTRSSRRSGSSGPRGRRAWSPRGGSSPTGALARMRGGGRCRARSSRLPSTGSSPCPASSSSGVCRGPPSSSTFSTPSSGTSSFAGAPSSRAPGVRSWPPGGPGRTWPGRRRARCPPRRATTARRAHAGFDPGSEERLQVDRLRLRHSVDLAAAASAAAEALAPDQGEGASELAARAGHALAGVAELAPELSEIGAEIADAEMRLREAASSVRSYLTALEAEPGRLESVEEELERIAEAKRRFQAADLGELLARADAARAELDALAEGKDPLEAAERALVEATQRVESLAVSLSEARREGRRLLKGRRRSARRPGDGRRRLQGRVLPRDPGPSGADSVSFQIQPNQGLPFGPVAETASGGELSRVALALRTVAHAGAGEPTIVFDEIDAGVGGRTAHAVAEALGRIAERAQVLTITHLPQIASAADTHFRVEKIPGDPTHTRIEALAESDRKEELERMLGGAEFLSTL